MIDVVTEEIKESMAQFQYLQQQLQSVLIQKESLRLHAMEIEKALEELGKTSQKNAYKMTGAIMISKPVDELKKELDESKETMEIRIKSLEKIEEKTNSKLLELQEKLKSAIK